MLFNCLQDRHHDIERDAITGWVEPASEVYLSLGVVTSWLIGFCGRNKGRKNLSDYEKTARESTKRWPKITGQSMIFCGTPEHSMTDYRVEQRQRKVCAFTQRLISWIRSSPAKRYPGSCHGILEVDAHRFRIWAWSLVINDFYAPAAGC